MTINLEQLREIANKANVVATGWKLDHKDTYVAAEKNPKEHDWYWITGSMERPDDGYNAEASDEDMRGPKEVVQACCRHIVAFNPEVALSLVGRIEELEYLIDKIAQKSQLCLDNPSIRLTEELCDLIRKVKEHK